MVNGGISARLQANPLWPVKERFPRLEKDIRKDVLVVGGGMAGISSAVWLKRSGYDVALIQKDEIGGPATGASSGVLYYGSGTNLVPAKELFGEERATALWRETAGVIDEIAQTAEKKGFNCGLRKCGSIMVAKTPEESEELEREFAAVRKLGLPARLLSTAEMKGFYPLREFRRGLAFDAVGQVHPARFGAALAREEGLEVFEQSPLLHWEERGGGIEVSTPRGIVRASELVIATNSEPAFGLEQHFGLEGSVILASQPTDRVSDSFPQEKIIWSMEEKYDLVYPRGDRLILELYALGEESSKIEYYFPGVKFTVAEQWGESWAKTADWIPIVGRVGPHVAVAIGMGDQGIIMSWLSGSKMPLVMKGQGDWFTEMASPSRFGGRAQAQASVKESSAGFEKFAKATDVQPGKIKVAKVGGEEVWVVNIAGMLFAHPNKCTHAGGPVGRGKLSGNVIQCPFHGSKFDVRTGSVVGPPAQRPLPLYDVKIEAGYIWVRTS